jgi:hypothetical protein
LELVHKEDAILQGLSARAANGIGMVHAQVPQYLRFRLLKRQQEPGSRCG